MITNLEHFPQLADEGRLKEAMDPPGLTVQELICDQLNRHYDALFLQQVDAIVQGMKS